MTAHRHDYVEAGFRIFGIHGVTKTGACACENPDCEALFKHPVISSWQNVPHWSEDQIEVFEQMGHFDTGFGVLCDGWLVVDVDARNGGVQSFKRLVADTGIESAFVVNTGSGGGSQHHYFRMPQQMALVQAHPKYPGIDFKTSGYVIGAGSMHASGAEYEVERGFPQDITEAPAALLDLLRKPEFHRVSTSGGHIDVNEQSIKELLDHIDPACSYEQWIKIGMAVHHCLQGGGFELWDAWSSGAGSYPGTQRLERHWHSFGKAPNPAGYGTLVHHARQGGYCEDVTFVYEHQSEQSALSEPVDLKRPPGFVGELTQWINGQCLYPRENLAVAAALCAVSGLAGMRFVDELDDMSANMIAFCVAGSGTGKEAVQQAYLKIMREAGVQAAVHGGFKSEQEIMRNLIRHQCALYSVDELGLVLRKLENASKRGGASYLEGIVGLVMSVYSKANGFLPITGDLKEEIRDSLAKELARAERQASECPEDSKRAKIEKRAEEIRSQLEKIDSGLDSPYLTILGYTTPVTFNDLMGYEQATNGFMARAMIFDDLETNPKRKAGFRKAPMTDQLAASIRNLHAPGRYDMQPGGRIEHVEDKTVLPTTEEAEAVLCEVYERFHQMADDHKGATGLEAIPRRGYELAAKVSMILAMPEGVRTAEHVRWAFALAERDVKRKISLAYASDNEEASGLAARVLSIIDKDHGETQGVICNRLRGVPKAQVEELLKTMVDKGMIRAVESEHPRKKTRIIRYFEL